MGERASSGTSRRREFVRVRLRPRGIAALLGRRGPSPMLGAYVLSFLPLPREFQHRLEAGPELSSVTYLTLSQLRAMGLRPMLRFLRTLNAERIVLAMGDEEEAPLQPYLQILVSLALAGIIEKVGPDLRRSHYARWQTIPAVGRIGLASIDGALAVLRSTSELQQLSDEPRLSAGRMRGKRIIYVKGTSAFGVLAGGSVGHTAGVVNGFVRRGFDVDFVAPHAPIMLDRRVQAHRVRVPSTCVLPLEANYYRVSAAITKQGLERALKSPPSFIYCRPMLGDYSGVALSRRVKVPLVVEYNGSEVWASKNWGGYGLRFPSLAERAEEVRFRHAHVVVTVSGVLRDELLARGVDAERIVCFPNCIDPAVFNPERFNASSHHQIRSSTGIHDDATVITFVGTFGRWHGAEVLAAAIRSIVEQDTDWLERRRVHFLMVGDGQTMPEVQEILAPAHCARFVAFTGLIPQAEAPAYLAASDIVVAPTLRNPDGSRFFGSPTKLFEYMAMGKGIVASDLEQIGEVLRDSLYFPELPDGGPGVRETALAVLTAPGSPTELIEGMRFLVDHPQWRAVLGANARRQTLECYTWDRQVAVVTEALEWVLEKDAARDIPCEP